MNNLNFDPLIKFLTTTFGDRNFSVQFLEGGNRPEIAHSDLMDSVGIFQHVIRSVSVDFFNWGKTETGYWGTISLSYDSHGFGSNGMLVCAVWYDQTNDAWTIKTERERYSK